MVVVASASRQINRQSLASGRSHDHSDSYLNNSQDILYLRYHALRELRYHPNDTLPPSHHIRDNLKVCVCDAQKSPAQRVAG